MHLIQTVETYFTGFNKTAPSLERGGVFVLSGLKEILVRARKFSKVNKFLALAFALALPLCCALVSAQTGRPIEDGPLAGEKTTEGPSPSTSDGSEQKTPEQKAIDPGTNAAKPGSVVGTLLDQSGAVSVGTVIRLTPEDKSAYREVISGDNGQFAFSNVAPGHFQLSVSSTGFGNEVYSGDLAPGQTFLAPPLVLSVATVVTQVKVTEDSVEVATEELKEQEHQRVLGFIPNFYVSYRPDAAPLTTKLKFHLAWKSSTDVVTFGGAAFLAGLQQAGDEYSEFGQGAQGYAKRFGAVYGDVFVSTFLSGAVFPSLLKQDPRYFYRGTGSRKKRLLYAIGNSVMCKGDNGRWQVNYSNIAGVVGGAAFASTYYPSRNQGREILQNSLIRMGESSLAGVVQEFVLRRLTKTGRRQDSPLSPPPETLSASVPSKY
ncbi:MAG TPA: carboxypeptidase-like regulatory domain-containing protein [Terriglobales bacterium]|nr:carboxypeptidase-like regulatory domain-containing protein [Terriglobales bacterium]